jgi:hypothetical protein
MKCGVVWCVGPVRKKKEKENTSVSKYHPLVSIQRRLNNESRKPFSYQTFLSKKHQTEVTSAEEVVGWLVVVAGGVAISKSPPPKGFIAIVCFK